MRTIEAEDRILPMPSPPLLLSHRGAHRADSIPENSNAAFDRALKEGCDGFECDVRLAACGSAVLCHDAKVNNVRISSATCAQVPHLARLEDIVRRYGRMGFLDIELKVTGVENKLLTALRDYPPERDYVVSSFLPEVVLELKARSALVPVGIICGEASQLASWRKLPVDYVIVRKSLVTRRLVQLIHDAGRKIFAWTVNDCQSMLRFTGWGVDGVISDNAPALLRLRSHGPSSSFS
jgi:glycerophosphoryl diester phosphodiesterase